MRVSIWPVMVSLVTALVRPVAALEVMPQAVATRTGAHASVLQSPLLQRTIAVDIQGVPLSEALQTIARLGDLKLLYGDGVLGVSKRVTLRAAKIQVGDAVAVALRNTGLEATISPSGQLVVAEAAPMRPGPHGTIVGLVTDSATGRPVAAVDILLNGTPWRTTTDTGGRYRLAEVDVGTYTLLVRRFGYTKQSRAVTVRDGQTDTVNVVLAPVTTRLNELVTTATGQRRRLDVANDITTINADSVMNVAPIRSVTDLLENRVPGLTVQHTTGAPGDPSRLRLRGIGSVLANNDPIVVVDGIRLYAQQSAARNANLARGTRYFSADSTTAGYTSATPSPLDYIDPNTIETIEVLKGPSAATLYGQDAANGVIVITTKKGKVGPTRWTTMANHRWDHLEGKYPELFWRAGHEVLSGAPVNCPVTNSTGGLSCNGDSITSFQLLNDPALTVVGPGHGTTLSLAASGGTSSMTYAVTGSYANDLGLAKLPSYEADRYQALLGLSVPDWMQRPQTFTRWGVTSSLRMKLGAAADLSLTSALTRNTQQKSSLGDQIGPLMSTFLDRTTGTYYSYNPSLSRPVAALNALNNYYERATAAATALTNGVQLQWRARQWLTFDADGGLNVDARADQVFFPRGPAYVGLGNVADTTGYVNDGQGHSVVSTVNLRGNALAPLGRGFQFRVAMGVNYTSTVINDVVTGSYHLPPGTSLRGDSLYKGNKGATSDATFGWYLEPSISNSKFNFTPSIRFDGGTAYGSRVSGLRLPTFPKLAFSYLVSDEPWFPLKDLFQSLRARIAYGKAGRQPAITDKFRLYNSIHDGVIDGRTAPWVSLSTLGNTDLRPERTTEFEGGFDGDLLDNRLTVSITGYRKTTDDALLAVPVAPSVDGAITSVVKNIGLIRNTGLELSVNAQVLRSGPVRWGVQASLNQSRNVLVKLAPGMTPYFSSSDYHGGGLRVAPGYPLFGRWSLPILGFADANGNGVLEPQEIQVGDTAVFVGATVPDFVGTFGTTVSLFNGAVSLDAAFAYTGGVAQVNQVAQRLSYFSAGHQVLGTSVAQQAATIDLLAAGQALVRPTDYNWIQNVSTTRFGTFSVRYNVPMAVARRLGAERLSVAFQGGNLRLWSSYRGIDPNVNGFGTGNDVADTGILPTPRTWQLQVNATY